MISGYFSLPPTLRMRGEKPVFADLRFIIRSYLKDQTFRNSTCQTPFSLGERLWMRLSSLPSGRFRGAFLPFLSGKGWRWGSFLRWNRIITMGSPGVAFGNTLRSQPESFEWAVNFYGINGIFRTARIVTARWGSVGRNGIFVEIHRQH